MKNQILIDFYSDWGHGDKQFQLFSIYYHNLFKDYLILIILNFQIIFTFKLGQKINER